MVLGKTGEDSSVEKGRGEDDGGREKRKKREVITNAKEGDSIKKTVK